MDGFPPLREPVEPSIKPVRGIEGSIRAASASSVGSGLLNSCEVSSETMDCSSETYAEGKYSTAIDVR